MAKAFLRQACADLKAFELLSNENASACQRLHYLQMWLEKLCKVYIWKYKSSSRGLPNDKTHQVISSVLPILIKSYADRTDKPPDMQALKAFAREVDLLHPQVDAGGTRPDNVEYPWQKDVGGTDVVAPIDWDFPLMQTLYKPNIAKLIKIARYLTLNGEGLLVQ